MSKTKYFVIGSTIAASLGGFFISGPSIEQKQNTAIREGYVPKPMIPIPGDVPTIGYGTTVYPNGTKVKMTDPAITRKQAFEYLSAHMDKDAIKFNQTLKNVKVSQTEYDVYLDFTYQYGLSNWSNSSMLRNLKTGNYKSACDSLLKYKYAAGKDCSIKLNRCSGVWVEQQKRHAKCIGAQ